MLGAGRYARSHSMKRSSAQRLHHSANGATLLAEAIPAPDSATSSTSAHCGLLEPSSRRLCSLASPPAGRTHNTLDDYLRFAKPPDDSSPLPDEAEDGDEEGLLDASCCFCCALGAS